MRPERERGRAGDCQSSARAARDALRATDDDYGILSQQAPHAEQTLKDTIMCR
jgi:hypothetical protein